MTWEDVSMRLTTADTSMYRWQFAGQLLTVFQQSAELRKLDMEGKAVSARWG